MKYTINGMEVDQEIWNMLAETQNSGNREEKEENNSDKPSAKEVQEVYSILSSVLVTGCSIAEFLSSPEMKNNETVLKVIEFLKTNTEALKEFNKTFGRIGVTAQATELGLEFYRVTQNEVSPLRFSYHLFGTSFSTVIGYTAGGGYGILAGLIFYSGEKLYDNIYVPVTKDFIKWQMQLQNILNNGKYYRLNYF